MASELTQTEEATTIDLTGLPEPVVQQVKQLVREARQKQAQEPAPAGSTVQRPPLMGRFEHLGISISKEELDEAQREAWANFPKSYDGEPGVIGMFAHLGIKTPTLEELQGAHQEELTFSLPAVGRFPTAMTVRAKFTVGGRLQPLSLPDLDDSP